MQTITTTRTGETLTVSTLLGTVTVYLHTPRFFDAVLLSPVQARELADVIRTGERVVLDTMGRDVIRTTPYPDMVVMSLHTPKQYEVTSMMTANAAIFCDALDAAANLLMKAA